MKTQLFKRGSSGLLLIVLPLIGACNQQMDKSPEDLVTVAFAEPTVQAAAETNAATAPAVAETPLAPVENPEPVPAALEAKPLPPSIKASGPLAEVIKLAQAGVDDVVMLTYITNSTSTFGLSSDEIIYLNDIGVPNNVVTTIIEHDQAMKQFWANAAQAQATASAPAPETNAEPAAAAPSYVNQPQAAPAEPPPTIVNNNYFYDTLSPYGSWINVEGYGLCWQPTVVVVHRGWQPYCDRGHWVYTDCGWYWLSDYSWGATTFHYGRWFSHPRWGWCWWPDRVWGPSWVTWRYGGDYCGWAPLPPFAYYQPGFGFSFHGRSVGFSFDFGIGAGWYTFVPLSHFYDPHPYRYRLPAHNVTQVFNKTTIINNFGAGSHNTVINHGISPNRITAVTKTEIRKVAIREAGPALARGGRGERLDRDGRSLLVHRPIIPETRLDPHRSTSIATVNPGRESTYAPLAATREAAENASRARPAASIQNKRDELRPVKVRSTFEEDRTAAPSTARVAPAGGSAPAPAAPATGGSRSSSIPRITPAPSPKSDSQPNRSPGPADLQRGRDRGPGHSGTVAPLIIHGSDVASQPAPAAPAKQTTPSRSLVVIGKRDAAPPRNPGRATSPAPQSRLAEVEPQDLQVQPTAPAPAPPTTVIRPTPSRNQFSQPTAPNAPQRQSPAPARTYNWPPGASPNPPRQEIQRSTRGFESPPSYSAPAPVQRQAAPSYSPPVSAPAPAPRYDRAPVFSAPSAPRSAPAPSYSPPPSSPAPSYSPPAPAPAPAPRAQPSPPSRSESGGPKGRNQ
jgi:hypothetical protein